MFCSLISFCLSRLGLLIVTSRAGWPLLDWSTTKKTTSSSSLITYLCIERAHKSLTIGLLYKCLQSKSTAFKDPEQRIKSQAVTLVWCLQYVLFQLYLLSLGLGKPELNLSTTVLNMRLASFAKSRSLISMTGTETMAKASLSSLVGQVPS